MGLRIGLDLYLPSKSNRITSQEFLISLMLNSHFVRRTFARFWFLSLDLLLSWCLIFCLDWSGIGFSWTRKVLSSVRAYSEQVELPFFLYERNIASKFFAARVRAKQMGLTADVSEPHTSFSYCLVSGRSRLRWSFFGRSRPFANRWVYL